ncbi:MAG: HEAT repeat domain-containing protein [Candidatus Micrarchaeia archaeon]
MINSEETWGVLELIRKGKTKKLVKLGREAADILIAELQNPHFVHKQTCINSLVEIAKSDEETFQRLIEELENSKNLKIKAGCAKALGLTGNRRATTALIEELCKNDGSSYQYSDVKIACAEALGMMRDKQAIPYLVKELRNMNRSVGFACIKSLGEIGGLAGAEAIIQRLEEIINISGIWGDLETICKETLSNMAKKNKAVQQFLIYKFENSGNNTVKNVCLQALCHIADPKLAEFYIKNLTGPAGPAVYCAEALGKIKDNRAIPYLLNGLEKEYHGLRRACAEALKKIGDPIAVDYLIKRLTDLHPSVRKACSEALKKIGDPRGLYFERVIYDDAGALKIGMDNTLKIIKEYLDFIADEYPEERTRQIRLGLFLYYRRIFEKESSSRIKMELPELKIRPPVKGPILYTRLKVAT